MSPLDRAFLWTRRCALSYRFALFTRILLAAGFIPTGLVKLLGQRFTLIPPENPIGAFFEALYQTGLYWQFLGLTQVVAGVLVLIPRLAHLGALLFFPIILNIFVITVSLGFRGTPVVTGLMLCAALYLCAWDFHRWRSLFFRTPLEEPVPTQRLDPWERVGFGAFAASLVGFFALTRGFGSPSLGLTCVGLGLLAGLFTLGRFLWVWWFHLRGGAAASHP